jgi:streptogramin lyase
MSQEISLPLNRTVRAAVAMLSVSLFSLLTGSAHAQERMYVTLLNNAVVTYDISLASASDIASSLQNFTNTNLNGSRSLAFDSVGNAYVSNYLGNTISKFDSSGNFLSYVGSASNLNGPRGITFDSIGNLYVANGKDFTISKFDATGAYVSNITTNLSEPADVVVDSFGNLYASNADVKSISKFDSTGAFVSSIATGDGPLGLTFDSKGNLYVTNSHDKTIGKYDTSGNLITTFGSGSYLDQPIDLAFDSVGNLYVANYNSNSISKFDSTGAFLTSWSTGAAKPSFLSFAPAAVPEPGAVTFSVLAASSILCLAVRKRNG